MTSIMVSKIHKKIVIESPKKICTTFAPHLLGECDSSDLHTILRGHEICQGTEAAAQLQDLHPWQRWPGGLWGWMWAENHGKTHRNPKIWKKNGRISKNAGGDKHGLSIFHRKMATLVDLLMFQWISRMCGWGLLRACLHFESQKKNKCSELWWSQPFQLSKPQAFQSIAGQKKNWSMVPTSTLQNKFLFPQFAPAWLEIQLLCDQPHLGGLRLFQGHVGSMIVGTRVPKWRIRWSFLRPENGWKWKSLSICVACPPFFSFVKR